MKQSDEPSWRASLATGGATLASIVTQLNETGLQIVVIVSSEGELIGTVTDGDIRRGLLKGHDMSSPVDAVVNQNPIVAPTGMDREQVKQFMITNKINALPVLNEGRQVIGLHLLKDLLDPRDRHHLMVIMAGGKGVRLRPNTDSCPKPMLLVQGKPMLEHIIERAKRHGVTHFIITLNYLGYMIEEYFRDGGNWGVKIEYIAEETALGTAGALGLMTSRPNKPFLVTNGDVLCDIPYGDLVDFHEEHDAVATMAVRSFEWQHPFGVVESQGLKFIGFHEKPISKTQINAGVYVLDPSALSYLERGVHCDMPDLFSRLAAREGKVVIYPTHESWLDVGRPDDLKKARSNA